MRNPRKLWEKPLVLVFLFWRNDMLWLVNCIHLKRGKKSSIFTPIFLDNEKHFFCLMIWAEEHSLWKVRIEWNPSCPLKILSLPPHRYLGMGWRLSVSIGHLKGQMRCKRMLRSSLNHENYVLDCFEVVLFFEACSNLIQLAETHSILRLTRSGSGGS